MNFIGSFRNYVWGGAYETVGMTPKRLDGNTMHYEGWGSKWSRQQSGAVFQGPRFIDAIDGWDQLSLGKKALGLAGSALPVGFTALAVYNGGKQDGLKGAYDAFIWDLAANAGVSHWAYGSQVIDVAARNRGIKLQGAIRHAGFFEHQGRTAGALVGSAIGQSIAGTPGAFLGGYLGAAPYSALRRHPVIGAATLTAMASYGSYQVVKEVVKRGHAYGASRRGIHTDGDVTAFMTQGAVTMRERAVQAMHKSHLNARSALGQEASLLHTTKNYNSMYR